MRANRQRRKSPAPPALRLPPLAAGRPRPPSARPPTRARGAWTAGCAPHALPRPDADYKRPCSSNLPKRRTTAGNGPALAMDPRRGRETSTTTARRGRSARGGWPQSGAGRPKRTTSATLSIGERCGRHEPGRNGMATGLDHCRHDPEVPRSPPRPGVPPRSVAPPKSLWRRAQPRFGPRCRWNGDSPHRLRSCSSLRRPCGSVAR